MSVDLNQVVKQVLEDFEISIEEHKANFTIGHLPVILAEPIQMNQLFHNLLSNSLKFSRTNSEITISSRNSISADFEKYSALDITNQYLVISVSDNGIGFDNRFQDRIFTLFQKLNDKKSVEGTGIGLAVCKKIAEDHGGFIFGQGEKGKGATFTIFLPH